MWARIPFISHFQCGIGHRTLVLIYSPSILIMLHGNDVLVEGGHYVISIYDPINFSHNTPKVFTHEGNDIYLRPYQPGQQTQVFRCTRDPSNRWGFVCDGTGVRMGRNRYENLKCESKISDQGSWECFYFNVAPDGGYKMLMTVNDRLCPLEITSDSGGEYLAIRARESNALIGLTRVGSGEGRRNNWPGHDEL
ncbi:hypothetical protein A0H81_10077 [Grifola frondosa]|uniref:Uncharacterized protein n=1 Tax=Grifola frondosa TaxID=5627 RepID=A0A1C7LYD5_GRIFR|nr:hypothetical protein A0H81_10077 [Grifola frondosa]